MKQAANSNQRVGIFVDVQNLYHSAKNLYQARVNYTELLKHLVGPRQLVRALAYVVKSEGVEPQRGAHVAPASATQDASSGSGAASESSFFEALEKAGFELRMKDLQIYAGGMKKGDWDVGLAVDAIRTSDMLDVVIIVTGDGDFVPLVNYLKWGAGRTVEAAAFRRSASTKLVEAVDEFINLETLPRVIKRAAARRRKAGANAPIN